MVRKLFPLLVFLECIYLDFISVSILLYLYRLYSYVIFYICRVCGREHLLLKAVYISDHEEGLEPKY